MNWLANLLLRVLRVDQLGLVLREFPSFLVHQSILFVLSLPSYQVDRESQEPLETIRTITVKCVLHCVCLWKFYPIFRQTFNARNLSVYRHTQQKQLPLGPISACLVCLLSSTSNSLAFSGKETTKCHNCS